jgi:hypothetical protein
MARTSPEQNKALVLEAFDTLFNFVDAFNAQMLAAAQNG